jgi:hypothetical protein
MFSELPKLFDRNFVIGYFLPFAILVAVSLLIINPFPFGAQVVSFLKTDLLGGTTALALLSWVGGIVLLAINRDLYRIMEGYHDYNPLKLFGWMERRRYRIAVDKLKALDNEYKRSLNAGEEFPPELVTKRNSVMRQLAEEFPDQARYLLPTPFGNALRAFEVYSRYMYGFDSIDGWGRLLAVIPKDYLELIDTAKGQVDFWVNLGFMFILLQIEYIVVAFLTATPLHWGVVLLFIVLGTMAPLRATSSAREWGDLVKSAFDMYRFELLELLGFDLPKNRAEEKVLWNKYSQAIVYRLPQRLPDLKRTPSKPPTKKFTSR